MRLEFANSLFKVLAQSREKGVMPRTQKTQGVHNIGDHLSVAHLQLCQHLRASVACQSRVSHAQNGQGIQCVGDALGVQVASCNDRGKLPHAERITEAEHTPCVQSVGQTSHTEIIDLTPILQGEELPHSTKHLGTVAVCSMP
eukprot:CAMPEP_0194525170 /NCGR_PEP_ID=MMETSP0253-20130528/60532_1 /TAXON_ID=2966 /ORGANISM="Noctiluca scintillans" /LENGTH=142 /DNA_ID=CAMNT_0039369867 /DNA_START=415 /DNA_END=843 /DNA_ORIENTATION=+